MRTRQTSGQTAMTLSPTTIRALRQMCRASMRPHRAQALPVPSTLAPWRCRTADR